MIQLRDYQRKFRRDIDEAGRDHRVVVGVMPTAGGKTVVFTDDAAETDGRVAIVAHRKELIGQAHAKAVAYGLDASIYPSASPGRVQVGGIQTFANRLDVLPRFKRIIVDEGHHAVAPTYRKFLDSQPDASVLLVTATPERMDGRGLGEIATAMVQGPSVAWLVERGYLARALVYGPPAGGPDLAGVRTIAGDYNTGDLEKVMERPHLLGSAPDHYEQICPGARAIGFCVSIEHAQKSAAAFRAEGWRFVAVWGDDPQRDAKMLAFAEGRLDGIMSCDLISEGLDIPDVGCVILQRPTQSLAMYRQMIGRGFRMAPGKSTFVVLDHAGNAVRHGLPTREITWTLDAPKRKPSKTVHASQCPSCFAIHEPGPVCPECGHDYRAAAGAEEKRRLEEKAGELALMTEDDRRLAELRNTPLRELRERARSFEDLQEIGQARGFHRAWAERNVRFLRKSIVGADGGEFV